MVAAMDDGQANRLQGLDEAARLRSLRALGAVDGPADPRFDRIARTAAALFGAPRAAVILVEENRLWHKARVGIPAAEYPRAGSLADLMIGAAEATISLDITKDPTFAAPLARLPGVDVRFYACAPLVLPDGAAVGLLAVGDPAAHSPAPNTSAGEAQAKAQAQALADLAALAVEELLRDAEKLAADRQRKLDQQRVDLALDAAGLGEFEWDIAADKVFISDKMKALTGVGGNSAAGDGGNVSFRFVHPEDADKLRADVDTALRGEGRYMVEYRMVRPDDRRTRWMQGAGVLVRTSDGQPAKVIGVVQDITDRKVDEEQRETLLAELDHRVKNVLAAVQSLAAQSARKTTSTEAFLATFAGRLKAMASAHELLTATRWRGAALAHLAAAELGGLAPGQASWEGPELFLTPRAANALSLALHELATNAVKYGALSVDAGRVSVVWRERPEGGFVLDWTETGGPPVDPPTRRGFGSTLLEQVTGRELGGEVKVQYRTSGVRARLIAEAQAMTQPADQPMIAEAPPAPAAGASSGDGAMQGGVAGLKILIVEDALLLALELEAGLEEAGAIIVGSAAEVEEAMAMLDQPLDAAVLDANLNGKSVAPVAEALKLKGVPFVFATGYGEKGSPEGFDVPIVRKPYNVHQIVRALVEAMRK
jgi:PAS domain S-box-containing protein